MKLRDFFEPRDRLSTESEIREFVKRSRQFDEKEEDIETAASLLFFQTPRQQTWLVSTEARLYCVLDDKQRGEPQIRWVVPRSELVRDRTFAMPIETRDSEQSPRAGLIDLGKQHKNWFYSKILFESQDQPIERAVTDLVTRKMIV